MHISIQKCFNVFPPDVIDPIYPFLFTTPFPEDHKISTGKNPFEDFQPGRTEKEDHKIMTSKNPFEDFQPGTAEKEEGMSAWTIYIIVGLVAGGVLLVGLVAIVVALCCNRIEDQNGYKHTSV